MISLEESVSLTDSELNDGVRQDWLSEEQPIWFEHQAKDNCETSLALKQ